MNFAAWTSSAIDAVEYAGASLPVSLALREAARIALLYTLVAIGMGMIVVALISMLQDVWRRPA